MSTDNGPARRVTVVDYGAANLLSISRALEAVGAEVTISDDPAVVLGADAAVLPGVGAAGAAMGRLRASGCDDALRQMFAAGRPLLGVCLGMQLFFGAVEEDDAHGLGLLPGTVARLPAGQKVPHIGWNLVRWKSPAARAVTGDESEDYYYFVHSYACLPANPALMLAATDYGGPVCAAVASGPLLGVQFHPEKSGAAGLALLKRWVEGETAGRESAGD